MDKIAKKQALIIFLKGAVMGSANVIPGVSGGTFAIILGILERLVDAVKSFNKHAIELLLKRQFKELAKHTDLAFLTQLFTGMLVAIFSLAKLLEYLLKDHAVYVWAFFFGLILASVYFVGKRVSKWQVSTVAAFVVGVTLAIGTSFLAPSVENDSLPYVFLCGVLAISAMVLPGLSGSFILLLLGNYKLIMIDGISNFRLELLIPFAAGCGVGLLAFSYVLSYVLKRFKDATISLLTGFILGSLLVIWPWQTPIYAEVSPGVPLLKHGEQVLFKYEQYLPDAFNGEVIGAIVFAALGLALMCFAERKAHGSPSKSQPTPQSE
jgi:putative membrane protein